ncbi:MAG TPA: DUF6636 domain-containing protein [Gaiellaceae bacterium]|nr:DUF6636 domain-containing protein [Gaiellaceae bacterium]
MKLRLAVGVAAGAVVSATGAFAASGGLATAADCSPATALEVGKRYAFDPGRPNVGLAACGAFLGPGSEAMVVTFGAPTCWPVQSWAVFGFRGGSWQLVKRIPAYLVPPLVVVGNGIRETTAVHRPGDARCLPSGGTHARTWRWNGTGLVAGPWKQVEPAAKPAPPLTSGFFRTPSGNIQCYGSGKSPGFVHCGIKTGFKPPPPRRGPACTHIDRISLGGTGRTSLGRSICPGEDGGDSGPYAPYSVSRVLGYGKTWSGGGISCTSAVAGLTCRNKSGHGFFLSRARWRSF